MNVYLTTFLTGLQIGNPTGNGTSSPSRRKLVRYAG